MLIKAGIIEHDNCKYLQDRFADSRNSIMCIVYEYTESPPPTLLCTLHSLINIFLFVQEACSLRISILGCRGPPLPEKESSTF